MERDPVRQKLKDLLWKRGLTMAAASLALGRNRAYLHQYLERGLPKVLNYPDSGTLGLLLDCDPAELRHDTVPKRKPANRTRRSPPSGIPGTPLSAISEMEVEAAAGPGALNEEFAVEKARWYLPEGMIRHEADANPEGLRILRLRGNSMEPEMSAGDRLVVDTARRIPDKEALPFPQGRTTSSEDRVPGIVRIQYPGNGIRIDHRYLELQFFNNGAFAGAI